MIFCKEQKISTYVVTQKIFFTISLRILEISRNHVQSDVIIYLLQNQFCLFLTEEEFMLRQTPKKSEPLYVSMTTVKLGVPHTVFLLD